MPPRQAPSPRRPGIELLADALRRQSLALRDGRSDELRCENAEELPTIRARNAAIIGRMTDLTACRRLLEQGNQTRREAFRAGFLAAKAASVDRCLIETKATDDGRGAQRCLKAVDALDPRHFEEPGEREDGPKTKAA